MKRLIFSMGLIGLLAAQVVMACPANCRCDATGRVISTNNNIINSGNTSSTTNKNTYNTTTTNSNNTDNSVHQITTSNATGGKAKSSVSNSGNFNGTVKGGSARQHQSQSLANSGNATVSDLGNAAASADNSGNGNITEVNENYRAPKIPVSTAYAPALTSGFDTCLGSLSGGAQTMPVGISFGGTKEDKNCVFIKKQHLVAENSRRVACFYMRMHDKEIDEAYKAAGVECPPELPPERIHNNDVAYATVDDLREVENHFKEAENRIFTRSVSK